MREVLLIAKITEIGRAGAIPGVHGQVLLKEVKGEQMMAFRYRPVT